jgi:thiamine biosynthesis lipoprotein
MAQARQIVDALLTDVEMSASRFRPDSDVSRIAGAHSEPVSVSPMTIDLVTVAIRACAQTDGLIDPTLAHTLSDLGYDRTISQVQAGRGRVAVKVRPVTGTWRQIEVDSEALTVRIPEGVALDLGATAKARAADLAAEYVFAATGCPVIVGLGGDLSAVGTPDGSDGWQVRIGETPADLADADRSLPSVSIESGGLATSTTQARRWMAGDRVVHHLIDPRTRQPAREVWRTATVAAASCVDANTASAAAIILGDSATEWLSERQLPARLVSAAGEAIAVADWPRESL